MRCCKKCKTRLWQLTENFLPHWAYDIPEDRRINYEFWRCGKCKTNWMFNKEDNQNGKTEVGDNWECIGKGERM